MAELDIKKRSDRVGRYFKKYIDQYIFIALSTSFLSAAGIYDIMKDVPVPITRIDSNAFIQNGELPMLSIAENMTKVMGCDPSFRFNGEYAECLRSLYGEDFVHKLKKDAILFAEDGKFEESCINFRAVLCMEANDKDAMYGYAMALREMYIANKGGEHEYTANFKLESMEMFELLTEEYPEVDLGHYYLGYAYINMGLYKKAEIVWNDFLSVSCDDIKKSEIRERLVQLSAPVDLENGCNSIISGCYDEGLAILTKYRDSAFDKWWPLYYYMGVGYAETGRADNAEKCFKKVLQISPSNVEVMKELVLLYKACSDDEKRNKYEKKIEIIENRKVHS